jgi:hypothetical protein
VGEGLFFWLILIAVAVLQGIGQKKKKPGQQLPRPKPRGQRPEAQDGSREAGADPGEDPSSGEGGSSEAMIPADIWEEILGLARGTPKGRTAQRTPSEEMAGTLPAEMGGGAPEGMEESVSREMEPRWDPTSPAAPRPKGAPTGRRVPPDRGANSVLRPPEPSKSQSGVGVLPDSDRREGESRVQSVRAELFGSGTLRELRKAIVHQEVLGRPVSLREDN